MLLVNIDGVDATGKTTLVNNLISYYTNQNRKVGFQHFPRYDTELGKVIKRVLLKETTMNPSSFQMLCSSDRLQWTMGEYSKLCSEYDIFLVDRYSSSAIVYGALEGLDYNEILFNDRLIAQPDAQLILYASVQTSLDRMISRDMPNTKYENAQAIEKATIGFLGLKDILPNVYYIDAEQSIEKVLKDAIEIINIKILERE